MSRGQAEAMLAAMLRAGNGGKIEITTMPDGRCRVVMVAMMPDGESGELLARALQAAYAVVREEIETNEAR